MLSKSELSLTYRLFYAGSKLRLLPVKVDPKNGRIELHRGGTTGNKSAFLGILISGIYGLFVLYQMKFWFVSSSGSSLEQTISSWYQLPIHITRCIGAVLWTLYAWILFVEHGNEVVAIFNQLRQIGEGQGKKNILKYSVQELLLLLIPYGLYPSTLVMVVIFNYDREGHQYLYSYLAPHFRSSLTHYALIYALSALEWYFVFFWISIGHFTVFVQISFFERTIQRLRQGINRMISKSVDKMDNSENIFRDLASIHLEVEMFNSCFAYIIFTLKIACILFSTVGFCFAIRLFHSSPVFSALVFLFGCYGVITFTVLYDHAFLIPELIACYKREASDSFRRSNLLSEKAEEIPKSGKGRAAGSSEGLSGGVISKRLASFPSSGVRVGQFQFLQRNSTLEFVDYIIASTVWALLTF